MRDGNSSSMKLNNNKMNQSKTILLISLQYDMKVYCIMLQKMASHLCCSTRVLKQYKLIYARINKAPNLT